MSNFAIDFRNRPLFNSKSLVYSLLIKNIAVKSNK